VPIRASVQPLAEPGHAVLRLSELDAAPEGLTISIQRQQGPDSHLADDGWRRTEAWLQPDRVTRQRDALEFHLGPEICDRLAGIATVRLRVREPDIGVVGTTVLAWPAMLTSGAVGTSGKADDGALRLRGAEPVREPIPEPAAEPELPPPLPPPRPELRGATRPSPKPEPKPGPPRRSSAGTWLAVLVAVLVTAGGGYYAYRANLHEPPPAPSGAAATASPPAAVAQQKSVRDRVSEYLASKPSAEAMLAKAREFAKADDPGAAFLVFRSAAETGNVPAELELAGFYDPLTQPPRGGFTADGPRAAEWYERAALAGSAEAQRKLGLLLAKGGAGLSPDPAKAKTWLQQAAAQNDAEAKKTLESLPSK
jgi:hypothetical protein